jgi:hypothetical protein
MPNSPKISLTRQSVFHMLGPLIEAIFETFEVFCPDLAHGVPIRRLQSHFEQRLPQRAQHEWCLSILGRINGFAGLYHASLVPSLVPHQTHDRCNYDLCVAYNIEKEDPPTNFLQQMEHAAVVTA